MRKKIFSVLQYVIFLGGGILLTWWQLHSMTPSQRQSCEEALKSANYWLLVPVIIMSLLSHLSRSMRWKLLMEPLGYAPKLTNVFASTMVGYFANSAVPRLGEVLKCTFLSRYEKLKFDKLFGTILVERAFDFVCYLLFIGITILLQIKLIGGYVDSKIKAMENSGGLPFWAKIILVVALIASVFVVIKWLARSFPKSKVIVKINSFLKGITAGFASIKTLRQKKLFLLHTFIIWALYMFQIYIGFSAMGGTQHLTVKAAFSVLSLATLAMIATPGGIGSFPFFVMETLLIYGIDAPVGLAFGWLIWGVNTVFVIIAGLVSLTLLPYMNRNKGMRRKNVHQNLVL